MPNQYVNKVVFGNQTLLDLTSDTVTPSTLLEGYTAHDKSGALIIGTATGGGGSVTQDQDGFIVLPPDGGGSPSVGGLEYETGIWTPSENIARPTIGFTNNHTEPPFYVLLTDATGDYGTSGTTNVNLAFEVTDWWRMFGQGLYYDSSTIYYSVVNYWYRTTNAEALTTNRTYLKVNSDTASEASTIYPRYWVTPTDFKPYTSSSSRYWIADRTYKWVAVWKPTT